MVESPLCKICGKKRKYKTKYKRRHGNFVRLAHWQLCEKCNLERDDKWNLYARKSVIENKEIKILRDAMI